MRPQACNFIKKRDSDMRDFYVNFFPFFDRTPLMAASVYTKN